MSPDSALFDATVTVSVRAPARLRPGTKATVTATATDATGNHLDLLGRPNR
jgi:hypothetical protein